jgi:predicted deacylase
LRPRIRPGEVFEAGQIMAHIVDLIGNQVDEIVADTGGVVISWADSGWVAAGSVLGTLGIEDPSSL